MNKSPINPSLCAYSSDASIYAIEPKEVISVEREKDIPRAISKAVAEGLSITPRGGGTGLAGGALGAGIILDFGRYRNIREINRNEKLVKVEVGIIYEELNRALNETGLFFPPDPSSGDTCQIGGMIANNSSGPRSVKYGLTSDFVEELEIFDRRSRKITLRKLALGSSECDYFLNEYAEYDRILKALAENKDLIRERWPKLKKNSSGYNLNQIIHDLDRGIYNLPALFTGSEGTLGIISTATLRLQRKPAGNLTVRLYFSSINLAGRAVDRILDLGPSGLEIVDGSTLNLIGRKKHNIPENVAGLLIVEFDDDIEIKKSAFEKMAGELKLSHEPAFADNPEAAAPLWKARKAIVPTLYRHHRTKRPVALVEDISLPPPEIPGFIDYITELFDEYNLIYGIFGHIGDGNLHVRPLFDLNDPDDMKLANELFFDIYEHVISIGGSTTAEHADGRLRAALVRKLYGEDIYSVFRIIKDSLDPEQLFSPGSVISDEPYREKIDYEKIKSYCAACGKCNGYCPAHDIFRREDFGARGWLRMINQSGASRKKLDEYLSYCLNCKNCAIVCPAGVDIASEIIEYKSKHPGKISKAGAAFADNETFLGLALKLGKLAEPIMHSEFGKNMIGYLGKPFGFDKSVELPRIAPRKMRRRFSDRIGSSGQVAFFHGCADNLLQSEVGEAVFKVFDHYGIEVKLPEQKCCGLPYEVHGLKDNLIDKAKYNIDKLTPFNAVITGCASCLLRLKEYPRLFKGTEYEKKAETLAEKCFDISQYLNNQDIDFNRFDNGETMKVTYHHPCHLRGAGLHKEPEKLIGSLKNVEIIHPLYADRCCAQAGSYGFTHFKESRQMFLKKREVYERIEAEYLMTSCPACQMKVRAEMKGNFKVVHPVEILAARLKL